MKRPPGRPHERGYTEPRGMDRELVVRAQGGDQRAFEALTVATHPRLFRLAHGVLREALLAEEATQQAFIDIWRFLRRLPDPSHFEAWSYRILLDACRDASGGQPGRATGSAASEALPEVGSSGPDPFGGVMDRDQLGRGFARLSVDDRAVIVMRYLLDLSVEDTAAALGVSPGTVASRLERALLALRAALDADVRLVPGASPGGDIV